MDGQATHLLICWRKIQVRFIFHIPLVASMIGESADALAVHTLS